MKKKEYTPMEKLTQGYKKLIKEKKVKSISKSQFENILKKAVIKKQSGLK